MTLNAIREFNSKVASSDIPIHNKLILLQESLLKAKRIVDEDEIEDEFDWPTPVDGQDYKENFEGK